MSYLDRGGQTMLHKMYLLSPDYLNKRNQQQSSPPPTKKSKLPPKKRNNVKKKRLRKRITQIVYDKWFKMRNEMREADGNRKALIRSIADLFLKILPVYTPPSPKTSCRFTQLHHLHLPFNYRRLLRANYLRYARSVS